MEQDNMEETDAVNPLYDMNSVPEVQKGDLMMSSGSTNPMYDFLSSEGTNGHTNSNDLLDIGSSNQDLLGSEKNHVNGSLEVEASVTQSEGLDGQNQNGGGTIDDFDLLGGNVATTPAVDEFAPKNEAIEDFEQESGSVEQEGGSSTSGELLVDSDVPNTRLVPEDDLLGETSPEPQESQDLLGGAVEPQESQDLLGGAVEPQESQDLLGGAMEPKESQDLLGGAVEPQVVEENKVEEAVEETVEHEEQLLVETSAPVEEEPSTTNNADQDESHQGGPESEGLLGDFSQNTEATEQEMAPEEDQKTVDAPQEIVEVQQEIPEEIVDVPQEKDDVQQLETSTDQTEEVQQEETSTGPREEEAAPLQLEEKAEEPAPVEDVSQQVVQGKSIIMKVMFCDVHLFSYV
jgi:hypothetical protein